MKKFLFTLIGIVVCIGASANDKITIEIQDLVLANGEKESDVLDVVTGRLSIQPGNLAFVAKVGDNKAVKPLKTGGWIFGKSVNKTLKNLTQVVLIIFMIFLKLSMGVILQEHQKRPH